ncbi:MAG TPA: amidohydrolase family protein, partial [Flavitalea sp.]|nr:amidohydrolase family protein [Flavitalea sp.]
MKNPKVMASSQSLNQQLSKRNESTVHLKHYKTIKKLITVMFATLYIVASNAQSDKSSIGPDMIVFNARITTQSLSEPEASALAVKKGRIYAVGTDAEILSLKANSTKLIDADGRRLIPGLNDSHIHILNEGNYNYNMRWDGVPTLKRAL